MQHSLKYLILKLHSLNEKQRDWVLANLSQAERDKVSRLLGEISNIKHSSNRSVLIQSINALTEAEQQTQIVSENKEKLLLQKIIKKLDKADSVRLSQVLEHEDPWLIALILNYRQWSWSKELEMSFSYDNLKKINQLRDKYNISLHHDIMLIILNILLTSLGNDTPVNTVEFQHKAIDFDEFSDFTNSQEFDSNKNWWRELWHT